MAKILLWPVNKKFEDTQRCKTCTGSLHFVERNCDDPQWYCSSLYIVSVVSGKCISLGTCAVKLITFSQNSQLLVRNDYWHCKT